MNNKDFRPIVAVPELPTASFELAQTIAVIHEAILDSSLWPNALAALAATLGAAGACCLIENRASQTVEWMSVSAPCDAFASDYMADYAHLDPYRPLLAKAPLGRQLRLSESVPEEILKNSGWYNNLLLKCGITDMLGVKLFESCSHAVLLGLHVDGRKSRQSRRDKHQWQILMNVLATAAQVLVQLRSSSLMSSAAIQAVHQLSAAVIVVDSDQRVLELNDAAERITRIGDGLIVREGALFARRSIDQRRLAAAIDAATAKQEARVASDGILVARGEGHPAYVLTVAPLNMNTWKSDRPLAMVLVVNPEWRIPSIDAVARAFGLSPAESRLAVALVQGQRMTEIAGNFGVEITTIRTQLSSILKKVGVKRQTDLIRVLGNVEILSHNS